MSDKFPQVTMTSKLALELRKSYGLNQTDFWGTFGLTQSAGSRYERDRRISKPLSKLINMMCGDEIHRIVTEKNKKRKNK